MTEPSIQIETAPQSAPSVLPPSRKYQAAATSRPINQDHETQNYHRGVVSCVLCSLVYGMRVLFATWVRLDPTKPQQQRSQKRWRSSRCLCQINK